MNAELARHGATVERVAYLDGVRLNSPDTTRMVATTLTIPRATLTPRWFGVAAEDMSAAGQHFVPHRLARLAQVHTHGNDWVGHSPTDDDMAYSQRIGSISIVLPFHGLRGHRLDGAGVHLRTADGWQHLSPGDVAELIQFIPSFIDLRESTCLESETAMPARLEDASNEPTMLRRPRWWSRSRAIKH